MATTEQRSGFRLPWSSDERPGTLLNGHTGSPTAGDEEAPVGADVPVEAEADASNEGTEVLDAAAGETVETVDGAAADLDSPATSTDPSSPEAAEMQETALTDPQPTAWADDAPDSSGGSIGETGEAASAWPAADMSSPAATAPEDGPTAMVTPSRTRRDNPLVAGLVRAMRDAAEAAREETAARFADEAKAKIESIQARSADEATELRTQADAEIVEIRDWSKAEMARIREETDDRIAARRKRLEADVEAHEADIEYRIERVQAAIGEFERRMDTFFEHLLAEEDPARLAALAEQLPEPPVLDADHDERDDIGATRSAAEPAATVDGLDARGAEAAEAEAEDLAGLYSDDTVAETPDDDTAGGGDESVAEIAEEDVVRRLEAFTGQPAHSGDASVSKLAVVGLVSVASIAGFKRALAKTAGVRSVTVASGPSGDFVFTVTHDPETELRTAVPALEGFAATITGDADGVLSVTANDPDVVH